MTTYDVHAHCVPPGLFDQLRRGSSRYGAEVVERDGLVSIQFAGGPTTPAIRDDLVNIEHRIATMDAGRVDVQLISSWIDLTGYGLPSGAAVRYTRMFNEALAATVALHPDRLLGLCTVPLQDPPAAAAELRRSVTEAGFVGAEIATTIDGVDLDDPGLNPFWGAAAELGCPILIHPYLPLAGRDMSRYLLENLVGRASESTIAVAHLVFGGVLERFPGLALILVHGGGFVPWQAARWDRGYEAAPSKTAVNLTRKPTESLSNVYFDTVLHDPQVVGFLVDWAGADRVVLGSDFPFPMGDLTPVDTLDAVRSLSGSDRSAILHGNVERLVAGIRR